MVEGSPNVSHGPAYEPDGFAWVNNGETRVNGSNTSHPKLSPFAVGDRIGLVLDTNARTLSFIKEGEPAGTVVMRTMSKGKSAVAATRPATAPEEKVKTGCDWRASLQREAMA